MKDKIIDKWFENLDDETEDSSYAAATTLATGYKLCDEEDIKKLKKLLNKE